MKCLIRFLALVCFGVPQGFAGGNTEKKSSPSTAPQVLEQKALTETPGTETLRTESHAEQRVAFDALSLQKAGQKRGTLQNKSELRDYPWVNRQTASRHYCRHSFLYRSYQGLQKSLWSGGAAVFGAATFVAGITGMFSGIWAIGSVSNPANAGTAVSALIGSTCFTLLCGTGFFVSLLNDAEQKKSGLINLVKKMYFCNHNNCVQPLLYDDLPDELKCSGNEKYLLRYPVMIKNNNQIYSLEFVMENVKSGSRLPDSDEVASLGSLVFWQDLKETERERVNEVYGKCVKWLEKNP